MLPVSRHLYPFLLDSSTVYIASAVTTQPDTVEQSSIGQLQEINSMSDFYSRYIHVYTCIIIILHKERPILTLTFFFHFLQVYSTEVYSRPVLSSSGGRDHQ